MEGETDFFDLLVARVVQLIDHTDPNVRLISNLGLLIYSELKSSKELWVKTYHELSNIKEEIALFQEQFFASKSPLGAPKSKKDLGALKSKKDLGALKSKKDLGALKSKKNLGALKSKKDLGALKPKKYLGATKTNQGQGSFRRRKATEPTSVGKKRKFSQENLETKIRKFSIDSRKSESKADRVTETIDLVAGRAKSFSAEDESSFQQVDTKQQESKPLFKEFQSGGSYPGSVGSGDAHNVEMYLRFLATTEKPLETLHEASSQATNTKLTGTKPTGTKPDIAIKQENRGNTSPKAFVHRQQNPQIQMPQSWNPPLGSSINNSPTTSFAKFGEQVSKPISKTDYVPENIDKPLNKKTNDAGDTLSKKVGEKWKPSIDVKTPSSNKVYLCEFCLRPYKQFQGGIIKHLIEVHKIPEILLRDKESHELHQFLKNL